MFCMLKCLYASIAGWVACVYYPRSPGCKCKLQASRPFHSHLGFCLWPSPTLEQTDVGGKGS